MIIAGNHFSYHLLGLDNRIGNLSKIKDQLLITIQLITVVPPPSRQSCPASVMRQIALLFQAMLVLSRAVWLTPPQLIVQVLSKSKCAFKKKKKNITKENIRRSWK